MSAPSLLPPNATRFETAHEVTDADRLAALDVSVIWNGKNALLTGEAFLPFLAWERSIDLWPKAWPIEKRREVTHQWWDYERLKGTPEGFRRFADLGGGTLVRGIYPPQRQFAPSDLTAEEREAYLSRFQQVRIYPWFDREPAAVGGYAGGGMLGYADPMTFAACGPDDDHIEPLLFSYDQLRLHDGYQRIAKLYEPRDGSETDLTHRTLALTVEDGRYVEQEEIVLPGRPSALLFTDEAPQDRWFIGLDGTEKTLLRMSVERGYSFTVGQPQYYTVVPSFDAIDIRPKLVAEPWPIEFGQVFTGGIRQEQFAFDMFAPPSVAWQHTYDVLWLHDPSRLPDGRTGTLFGDVGERIEMPIYNAQLQIELVTKRHPDQIDEFAVGFSFDGDTSARDQLLDAVAACQAARDSILVTTKTWRDLRLSDRPLFGFRFGDLTRSL